jgi:amino acid adenylation domain-containing protein
MLDSSKLRPGYTQAGNDLLSGSIYDPADPLKHVNEWVESSIPGRFLQQLSTSADLPAIRTDECTLTYSELNILSNRVANTISERTQPGQEAVCLLLAHNDNVPAAILGILKSGKFYVFIDPNLPSERIDFLIDHSGSSLVIASNNTLGIARKLATKPDKLINVSEMNESVTDDEPDTIVRPDDIAYVIYTSGSTGVPKGVIHTHRSVLHKQLRQANGLRIDANDRIGLLFSYSFGPAADNFFGALLNGAVLVPFDIRRDSAAKLLAWLNEERITIIHLVPTYFRHLVSSMDGDECFTKLRVIRLSGETIFGDDVRLYQKFFRGQCTLHIGFGSTETGALLHDIYDQQSSCPEGVIPLGYPTEDMHISLRKENGDLAETGEIGEIAVSSRYMFSGYWNDPTQTAKVLAPSSDSGSEQTYLMGDLGCLMSDHRFMHLGRKDTQVKVRGNRIEISEVEHVLITTPGVSQAAIIAKDMGIAGTQLIAYIVRDSDASMPTSSLRSHVTNRLPDYMIPTLFLPLRSMPLTITGKIDRAALTARPLPLQTSDKKISDARDFIETQLVAVWEDLLQRRDIGIQDDFFELGGDSLLAMKLTLQIEEIYGRDVNLANFPAEVTIEMLANVLESEERENLQKPILEIQKTGTAPPLYFLHGDYICGGGFCRNLARHLGSDQPFYAIPPHGLDGRELPRTIEAMAADRLDALLEFQPEGPYRLGGFCWGGFVALEMARMLGERGADVETILLVDSDARNIRLRPVRRFLRWLRVRLSLSEELELASFRKFLGLFPNLYDFNSTEEEGRHGFSSLLQRACWEMLRGTRSFFGNSGKSELSKSATVTKDRHSRFLTYHQIFQTYVAEPFEGNIVLFRSSRLRDRYPDDPLKTWRHITPDLQTYSVTGDHLTCITKHVEDLAKEMKAVLKANAVQTYK